MSRIQTLFAIVLPSMLAGGVLFGSAPSRADAGLHVGFWPDDPATVVAQATPPSPPSPPMPPMPATPRTPHMPPVPPIPIGSGAVVPDDIRRMVDNQIQQAIDHVKNNPQIPANVRAKVIERLEKVRAKTRERLKHIKPGDVDEIGEQMGALGEEIGAEMEQFGDDMQQWGEQFGKQFGEQFGKQFGQQFGHQFGPKGVHVHISHNNNDDGDDDDDDDDDDNRGASSVDVDDQGDVDDDVVVDLGDLSLKPPQRDQIQKLRADSIRQVAAAKHQLEQASSALKKALDNISASDADIARAIDAVSQQEAAIRKARILAWHDARRLLDDAQRKKVMDAAKGKTK